MLINKKDKIIIVSIIILMIILSIILIFNIIHVLKYREGFPKDIVYVSDIRDRNEYQVFLKPNTFIEDEQLDGNLSYITSLIEYINTTFIYEYEGDADTKIDYSYLIKANIVSEYIGDAELPTLKPVWNKEFILLEPQTGKSVNSKINISETLKIGLDYYNNLVEDFRTQLNIPIKSVLEIRLVVNIAGKVDNYNLNKEHYMLMSIPLSVKAFDITTSKNFVEKEITYSKEPPKVETSYMKAIIYIIILISIIYLGIYIIKHILNTKKSKYVLEVENILKEYDDRIVTVSNFINYSKLEVVEIPDFDELLNLSDESYEPIIHWEKKERGNRETWFCILRNKVLYRYIISKSRIKEKDK